MAGQCEDRPLYGSDVLRLIGREDDRELEEQTDELLTVVTAMARAYTRGGGFNEFGDPNQEVAAVIKAGTLRLLANPEQLRYQAGSVQINDSFRGWTLAESYVLNRYRRRAR